MISSVFMPLKGITNGKKCEQISKNSLMEIIGHIVTIDHCFVNSREAVAVIIAICSSKNTFLFRKIYLAFGQKYIMACK